MKHIKNYLSTLKKGINALDVIKLQKIEEIIFNKIKKNKKYLYVEMVDPHLLLTIFYVISTKE